jgi:hypothetical protein
MQRSTYFTHRREEYEGGEGGHSSATEASPKQGARWQKELVTALPAWHSGACLLLVAGMVLDTTVAQQAGFTSAEAEPVFSRTLIRPRIESSEVYLFYSIYSFPGSSMKAGK